MIVSTMDLRRWHRRLALVLGVVFIIQGLTGSILQQKFWLAQASDPALYHVAALGAPLPPAALMALVKRDKPDFRIAHMMYPAAISPNTAVTVMGGRNAMAPDMSRTLVVDQYGGRIIREQPSMSGWIGTAYVIHRWLAFGVAGKIILTLLGVGVLAFSLLGLVIWWRTRETGRHTRGIVRIHRTMGLVASVFIIPVALTGTWLNLTTWVEDSSGRSVFASNMKQAMAADMQMATSMQMNPNMPMPSMAPHPPSVDAETAYRLAMGRVGAQHLAAFGPPGPHAKNYWFAFTDNQLKETEVLVDPDRPRVIGVYPTGLTSGGDGVRAWLLPIHTGFVIGPIGGVIYSVIGVSVTLWVLTGFIIWSGQLRRRRPRRASVPEAARA